MSRQTQLDKLAKIIKRVRGNTKPDCIQGGKADGMSDEAFSPEQIRKGMKVESEHTNNPMIAKEISKDHLSEFPDYYTRLAKMEEQAKKGKKK